MTSFPEGYYYDSTTRSKIECPAGSYCVGKTTAGPVICPINTYSETKASSCISVSINTIQPGYYYDSISKTKKLCSAGSYCAGNTAQPVKCENGYYSNEGSSSSTICPTGSQCPNGIILPCPTGYYSNGKATSCIKCQGGFYVENGIKYKCPAGSYCSGDGRKVQCLAGTYCPEGSSYDQDCGKGFYCETPSTKLRCQPGFYNDNSRSTVCKQCETGKFPTVGSDSCQDCPIGYYNDKVGQASCTQCPLSEQGYRKITKLVGSKSVSDCGLSINSSQYCNSSSECLPIASGKKCCGKPEMLSFYDQCVDIGYWGCK